MSIVVGGSRHMRTASVISMVIADAKQQTEIQLKDVVAAIYVANFDRIAYLWPTVAQLEDFIAEHCGWSEHRLMTWNRYNYNTQHPPRTIRVPFTARFFQFPKKYTIAGKIFKQSDELKQVIATAQRLGQNKVNAFGRETSLLTPELVLLAVIRTEGVELGKLLIASHVNVEALESAALEKLDNPEKLLF